jgi:hypothetical protein
MAADKKPKKQKPKLILLPGDATFEELTDMFRELTGREPTEEDLKEAREVWHELEKNEERSSNSRWFLSLTAELPQ